jgi:hypothetical protein
MVGSGPIDGTGTLGSGTTVGRGVAVTPLVGLGVGAGVGAAVGAGVGAGVGAAVGAGVGAGGFGVGVGARAVTVIVTVLVGEDASPSNARYVNVRVPVNEPPDVNVKLPFAFRSREPLPPPSTRTAVNASPSASESLARTPAAGTDNLTPVVALYASFAAVGAFGFVTVRFTVAVSVTRMPRFKTRASYLNESAPT